MPQLDRYGSREIMDFQIFNFVTKNPIMTFDYATSVSMENTSETVYARGGRGNPRRIAWHGDKETTITVETQIFTMQHLALLAGEEIQSGNSEIYKNEILTVEDDGLGGKIISLSKTPLGDETDVAVYKYEKGILVGEPLTVSDVTGKDVTLTGAINIGDEVSVYYRWQASNTHSINFTAQGFPPYIFMVGDTVYPEEIGGNIVSAQIKYYKAKLQPNFTIDFAPTGDPSTLTLTFDVFPVKVDGKDTLYTMTIYED